MAGDRIQMNTRERAVTDDINDLQAIANRNMMESWKYFLALNANAGVNVTVPVSTVLGGLDVNVGANPLTLEVSPGVMHTLRQAGPGGPFDSDMVFSRQSATHVIPEAEFASGNGYYLIEAIPTDMVTLNTSRDVFDPGLEAFVPAPVDKVIEAQITYTVRYGTSLNLPEPLSASGGDETAIAGVRMQGGDFFPVIDLRPIVDERPEQSVTTVILSPHYARNRWRTLHNGNDLSSPTAANQKIAFDFEVLGQSRFYMQAVGGFQDPVHVSINDFRFATPKMIAAFAAGDEMWMYFYTSRWFGYTPRNAYAGLLPGDPPTFLHQGVLTIEASTVASPGGGPPLQGSRIMPSGITLPAPFAEYTSQAGDGVCVGGLPFCDPSGSGDPQMSSGSMHDDGHITGMTFNSNVSILNKTIPGGLGGGATVDIIGDVFTNSFAAPMPLPTGISAWDMDARVSVADEYDQGMGLRLIDSNGTDFIDKDLGTVPGGGGALSTETPRSVPGVGLRVERISLMQHDPAGDISSLQIVAAGQAGDPSPNFGPPTIAINVDGLWF